MSQSKINVAIVDDDESFARALERLFRASGYGVQTYPSAEALLASTTLPQPDCLVLDIHLGGMSGLDLRQQLSASGRTTPVVFVTAHDEPKIREQALQAGCSAYLRKPVPGKMLLAAIGKAVNPGNH